MYRLFMLVYVLYSFTAFSNGGINTSAFQFGMYQPYQNYFMPSHSFWPGTNPYVNPNQPINMGDGIGDGTWGSCMAIGCPGSPAPQQPIFGQQPMTPWWGMNNYNRNFYNPIYNQQPIFWGNTMFRGSLF